MRSREDALDRKCHEKDCEQNERRGKANVDEKMAEPGRGSRGASSWRGK